MGWASGSELATNLGRAVRDFCEHKDDGDTARALYTVIVKTMSDFDCDTLEECRGEVSDLFDAALAENGHISGVLPSVKYTAREVRERDPECGAEIAELMERGGFDTVEFSR